MMPLELYLIRHGESVNNTKPDFIGGQSVDTPLTPLGERQAALLGQYLRDQGIIFDAAYASPAKRAARTAQIACSYLGISRIGYSDKLLEISQGDWAGRRRSTTYTPEIIEVIEQDPLRFKAPNGESHKEVEERGLGFLEDIGYGTIDGKIGIFGHGMLFKCMLRGIMRADPHMTWKIGIENTSVTKLRHDMKGWHLDYLNATAHLDQWRRTYAADTRHNTSDNAAIESLRTAEKP